MTTALLDPTTGEPLTDPYGYLLEQIRGVATLWDSWDSWDSNDMEPWPELMDAAFVRLLEAAEALLPQLVNR